MKRSIIVNIITISIWTNTISTSAISTADVLQESASCDVVLDFSNMGLTTVNPNFISNPYIKSLALRNNSISSFQENTFGSLPNLEYLDLSNNKLNAENLFSFGNLHVLKSLTLDYNSKNLYGNPYYQGLCSENQYYTIYGQCEYYSTSEVQYEYPMLTHLSMKQIFINSLANDWAKHFPQLTHLDISENNFFTTLEEVISRLPATVISLTMSNVKLTAFKTANLKSLTQLNLNHNKFEAVSRHYCYENTLCLQNLTDLEMFNIAECSIKKIEIDAFKDAKKLIYLDMAGNDFEEIPDGTFEFLSALSYLDLSRTKLLVMPNFSALQNLTFLNMNTMHHNKELLSPTALETFPELTKLEKLWLLSNELMVIPSKFLNKLPKLSELNLSFNKIASLPSYQWQNRLRNLWLDFNAINNFEDLSLKEAESLKLLSITHNKFTFIQLQHLKHLPDDVFLFI